MHGINFQSSDEGDIYRPHALSSLWWHLSGHAPSPPSGGPERRKERTVSGCAACHVAIDVFSLIRFQRLFILPSNVHDPDRLLSAPANAQALCAVHSLGDQNAVLCYSRFLQISCAIVLRLRA